MNNTITVTEKKTTNDLYEVVEYFQKEYSKIEKDVIDTSEHTPFLVSTDGNIIAKLNHQMQAVGFYYKKEINGVYYLEHVDYLLNIKDVYFNIHKVKEVNLLFDDLPQGDIIVKYVNNKFGDGEVVTNTLYPEMSLLEFCDGFSLTNKELIEAYYIGLSTNNPRVVKLDLTDLREFLLDD